MKNESYCYQPTRFFWVSNALIIAFLAAWFYITFDDWKYGGIPHILKGLGSTIGVTGYFLFSFSLFLSSRIKKLEDWFGSLDQIYHLHHKIGLWGFYFLLCHPWFYAVKWILYRPDKFFLFIFPIHHRISVNVGSYAFWLMLFIIGATIFKLFPYDKWKLMHRFMSLVFILATFHIFFSQRPFNSSKASLVLICIPMGFGFFGVLYKQIFTPFFFKTPTYKVVDAEKINDNIVKVTFKPEGKPLNFFLGQYAFFSFQGKMSKEQHPFTICKEKNDSRISIFVKARGDFTKSLYNNIRPGFSARLEGPYGRFDYTKGGANQIWIAGGIGIVPFLAWKEQIPRWPGKIDFFYCVHRIVDAVLFEQFQNIQSNNFNCFLFCTEMNKHLTVTQIAKTENDLRQKDVFMCGPRKLTHSFASELVNLGIKRKNIYFEDFEFF